MDWIKECNCVNMSSRVFKAQFRNFCMGEGAVDNDVHWLEPKVSCLRASGWESLPYCRNPGGLLFGLIVLALYVISIADSRKFKYHILILSLPQTTRSL